MKEILEKISSYNLFNNLFPGVLFVLIAKYVTAYNFIQSDIVLGVFLYYFIGLVISRIGSLLIDPVLKAVKFIKVKPYDEYVMASKQDEKINLFAEINNMYRTICAMAVSVLILRLYEYCVVKFQICDAVTPIILGVSIAILFLFSYRKQTKYIIKRIDVANKNQK